MTALQYSPPVRAPELSSPLPADSAALVELALGLAATARERDVTLKALGGVGCWLHVVDHGPDAVAYGRSFHDLDLVVPHKQRQALAAILGAHGLRPVDSFNAVQGETRLMYSDEDSGRVIDVFLGQFAMCHTVPLDRDAFAWTEHPSLDLVELVLTKLQVVESNPKDLHDVAGLLALHELGDGPERLDGERLARRLAADWGLWRTVTGNLDRLAESAQAGLLPAHGERVLQRTAQLREHIDRSSKTLRWKARARVGERVPWYDTPEEPESDWSEVR
jgi:hypothetical protein